MFQELEPDHFEKLGSALFNTGNLSLGGALFSQVTSDKPFDLWIAVGGVTAWACFFWWAMIFMQMGAKKRKEQKKKLS